MTASGKLLADLDTLLAAEPFNARHLAERAVLMLELDNPHEIAHAARMLIQTENPPVALLDHLLIRLLNHAEPPKNISIGGGANYHYAGWLNFDSAAGPLNPRPLKLDAECSLPYPSGAARIVYSSHCLEHLDDASVSRVLRESLRVLRNDGALVLKLPDFEQVLERWRAGDERYFDQWGMKDVIPTWRNLGVEATIDAKAAFIFCGWWNDAYGDEFGGRRTPDAPGAYHGPVLSSMSDNYTPHDLARLMRQSANVFSPVHFNHQNAWSGAELEDLLEAHGFDVLSMDADAICERYADIPGINAQRAISMYAVAV